MASLMACKFPSILQAPPHTIRLLCNHSKHSFWTSLAYQTAASKTCSLHIIQAQNPSTQSLQSTESLTSVVTDESVPEGHAGLHGFLYGDKGAEVHGFNAQQIIAKAGEDDGSSILTFQDYVNSRDNLKFGGVYAIYDAQGEIQYVGYSRNVILSLKSHMERVGESMCCSVKVKMFTDSSIISRGKLEEEKQKWINQYGVPPGNSIHQELWENGKGAFTRAMSEEEREIYEERKLKMRKAMGENLYDEVEGEDEDSRNRRLNLLRATEGDDWSGVIDGQTKDTLGEAAAQPQNDIVSPFSGNGKSGLYSAATYDLTAENVDMVLNDVRPYLIADGGNVEVVSAEKGVISLRLQGACGTCPSSTVTMNLGIERVLKEKFGDALKEIRQVDQQDMSATVVSVNSHLDMLRPAINNYGGSVEVISVGNGECHVKYSGPGPIGMGVQAAIKDKFPDITNVVLINP
ncbi:hypothetical protein SUGI_0056910 [Cryptomeria japonica]|uniref:uncharacterized protein LOC131064726 n=1 Tax=Cryptomeria japonica TaxID=3369 RepID=UPI002408969D|nr:uncharacterized protein LOC131064726 [Cryptomeria japonica]GLJ07063.1 hypothetical protein SUGI_0056910 [Cryptomeria japonica]